MTSRWKAAGKAFAWYLLGALSMILLMMIYAEHYGR